MDENLSRRGFIKKTALAVTAVAASDIALISGAMNSGALTATASEGAGEDNFSHVGIKLWPGRSEQTRQRLAEAIAQDVTAITGCNEDSVSVAIEEIDPKDWEKRVYHPLINGKRDALYKNPGYEM